jgi:hypothetical protein
MVQEECQFASFASILANVHELKGLTTDWAVVFFRSVWSHVANGRNRLKHMFRMETL